MFLKIFVSPDHTRNQVLKKEEKTDSSLLRFQSVNYLMIRQLPSNFVLWFYYQFCSFSFVLMSMSFDWFIIEYIFSFVFFFRRFEKKKNKSCFLRSSIVLFAILHEYKIQNFRWLCDEIEIVKRPNKKHRVNATRMFALEYDESVL